MRPCPRAQGLAHTCFYAIGAFAACAGRAEGGRVFFPLPRKRGQRPSFGRPRIPVQGQSTLVAPHGAGERQQSIDRTSFPRQIALRLRCSLTFARLRSERGRLVRLPTGSPCLLSFFWNYICLYRRLRPWYNGSARPFLHKKLKQKNKKKRVQGKKRLVPRRRRAQRIGSIGSQTIAPRTPKSSA